ncbi:hypothetical protein EK904_002025, partial [Melospiza melodia maxima]
MLSAGAATWNLPSFGLQVPVSVSGFACSHCSGDPCYFLHLASGSQSNHRHLLLATTKGHLMNLGRECLKHGHKGMREVYGQLEAAGSAAGGLQEVATQASSAWPPTGSLLMQINHWEQSVGARDSCWLRSVVELQGRCQLCHFSHIGMTPGSGLCCWCSGGGSLSCQTRKSCCTSDKANEDCSVTPAKRPQTKCFSSGSKTQAHSCSHHDLTPGSVKEVMALEQACVQLEPALEGSWDAAPGEEAPVACPLPAAGCERLMCSSGASTPAVPGALACAVGFLAGLTLLFTDPYKNFLLCLQTEMVKAILLMAADRHHALMSVAH